MKNKFSIYKLHFTTPLHLGDARDDYSVSMKTIYSDTMYAALTSCLAKIGKSIPDDGDLGFTISSLFPFYQKNKDSKAVYFFPKGYKKSKANDNTAEESITAKDIKKIQWIDANYFEKRINSNDTIYNDGKSIQGEYLTREEVDKDFIQSEISPRVTVSRTGEEDAKPFYMDRLYFKGNSGLYFLVLGDTKLLDIGIDILQHEGIGTDRNVGNGFFTFSKDEIELETPENSDYVMSLSLFIPESKEQLSEMLSGEKAGYDFVRRGGWVTTPPFNALRKNAVYAFMHGSVFSLGNTDKLQIKGRIVDLKPELPDNEQKLDHSIWRNGKTLFIPVKM